MKAKDFLKIYLGGNMFVETLTPKAIAEFAEDYHNKCTKELLTDFMDYLIKENYCLKNPVDDIVNVYIELNK